MRPIVCHHGKAWTGDSPRAAGTSGWSTRMSRADSWTAAIARTTFSPRHHGQAVTSDTKHAPTPAYSKSPDAVPTLAPWHRLSRTLRWLHERAWPLGGMLLLASIVALRNYLLAEHIPVGVSSPAFVAALPAVFAYAGWLCLLLLIVLLAPGWVFLTPFEADRRVANCLVPTRRHTPGRRRANPSLKRALRAPAFLLLQWIVGNLVIAAAFIGASVLLPESDYIGLYVTVLVALTVLSLVLLMTWMAYPESRRPWNQRFSRDFLTAAFTSAVVQTIVYLASALLVSRLSRTQPDLSLPFTCIWLALVFVLALCQWVAVWFYRLADISGNRVDWVMLGLTVLILGALLLPATGSFLIRTAIQSGIHDDAGCLELHLTPGTTVKYQQAADTENATPSTVSELEQVRVLFDTGDSLYVRAIPSAHRQALTWRVAAIDIAAVRPCTRPD